MFTRYPLEIRKVKLDLIIITYQLKVRQSVLCVGVNLIQ